MAQKNSKYKLTYFDMHARGEAIRLLFTLAKIPFQDVRIALEDWPKLKPIAPWGSLPFLEVDDGDGTTKLILAQHCTIGRFLARRFNLIGKNEVEQAKCDEVVDAVTELLDELLTYQVAAVGTCHSPDAKKAAETRQNLIEISIPRFFTAFNTILIQNGGRPHIVGDKITWADVWLANIVDKIEDCFGMDIVINGKELYPNLYRAKDHLWNLPVIKEYVAKRRAVQL